MSRKSKASAIPSVNSYKGTCLGLECLREPMVPKEDPH